MGFINLGRLNIRKRNSCASALVSLSDVQPPSVYKSHILNGPINKLYETYKRKVDSTVCACWDVVFICIIERPTHAKINNDASYCKKKPHVH